MRPLCACVLAFYTAAVAIHAVPMLQADTGAPAQAVALTDPFCCPMACALAGQGDEVPQHNPVNCESCEIVLPACVAAMPPELAGMAWPTPVPAPWHEVHAHSTAYRGPASPRDPPASA